MAKRRLWIGNDEWAGWAPSPKTGMQRAYEGRSEEVALFDGGLWIDSSAASHAAYQLEFPASGAKGATGIEVFPRLASGEYGFSYIRFIDLMRMDENLFNQNWAAPALAVRDWKPIHDTEPTFVATDANAYGKPPRKAVYNITSAANAEPVKANSTFTLLIPPTHKIVVGATGSATGTGVLRVQPINLDGTLATPVDVTLGADNAAPAFTQTFSGATYRAVRIFLTRTSAAASTVTLAALWAQCVPSAATPVIERHMPGMGHSGLRFRGATRTEEYIMANGRKLIGASIALAEVQPWSP